MIEVIVCTLLLLLAIAFLIFSVVTCTCECEDCESRCECSNTCPTQPECPECPECSECEPTSIFNENTMPVSNLLPVDNLEPTLDRSRIGFTNNEWVLFTGRGANTQSQPVLSCVGMGKVDDFCDSSRFVCARDSKFGVVDEQWALLEEAMKNGGKHPDCPL